jgi:hypothetical protein
MKSKFIFFLINLLFLFCCNANSSINSSVEFLKQKGGTFPALSKNEHLAYKMRTDNDRHLQLYAINDYFKKARLIGEWDFVEEWGELQFTSDKRVCFFSINDGSQLLVPVFYVNGMDGTIKYIGDYYLSYKSSANGDYLLAPNKKNYGISTKEKFLLVKIGDTLSTTEITWNITNIEGASDILIIRDNESNFKILECGDGGLIIAAVQLDSINEKINVLWDKLPEKKNWKYDTDSGWFDNVNMQYKDSSIKLE